MISVNNLSKKYHDQYAVKNVSFSVNQKETLVILGPSGSGKSTILRCICNLETPSDGEILIDGKKLNHRSSQKIKNKIGVVFQNFCLFPHMNVIENLIYTSCKVRKVSETDAKAKAMALLKDLGIENKADFMPNNLSGGQKQRVAIARALMLDPEIMLFDEPTSALDPEIIKDVVDVILALKNRIIIIVVTHHMKFAKAIADRIIFMDQGRVLCDQVNEAFFIKPKSQRARLFLDKVGEF